MRGDGVASGGTTTLSRAYTWGLSLISQRQPGMSTNFFVFDGHGSTRLLTDSSTNVVNAFAYDAYGTLIASNGAAQTAYLYCSEPLDSNVGLYHDGARELSVGTGRFWTRDTYEGDQEDPGSLHKYLYANDNPATEADPLGLAAINGDTSSTRLGKAVEKVIMTKFREQFGILALTGKSLLRSLGLLGKAQLLEGALPDLVNTGQKSVFEIKPNNKRKIAEGIVQLEGYVDILNWIGQTVPPWHKGTALEFPGLPLEITVDEPPFFVVVVPPTIIDPGLILYSTLDNFVKKKAQNVETEEEADIEDSVDEATLNEELEIPIGGSIHQMTFDKMRQEFDVRCYLWAASEWEKEISESFPRLREFKTGAAWEVYQLLSQLEPKQQLTLARGLLKRNYPVAVRALGEKCSPEEELLRSKRDEFFRIRGLYRLVRRFEDNGQTAEAREIFRRIRPAAVSLVGGTPVEDDQFIRSRIEALFSPIPPTFEEELAARKLTGHKIKFAARQTLRKTMIAKFSNAFGDQCIGSEYLVRESEPQFQMRCCGWELDTVFSFESGNVMDYIHIITSEDTYHIARKDTHGLHSQGKYSAHLVIGNNISLCSWLGISGATRWEYLTDEEVEPSCDAAVKFCRHFFDVAPRLLKGLNLEFVSQ